MVPLIAGVGAAVSSGAAAAAGAGTFLGLSATTWTIIGVGFTAVSAYAMYQAQNAQIDNFQIDMSKQIDITNEQFAIKTEQEHQATMDKMSEAGRAARIAAAHARVVSGEAGVSGLSVDQGVRGQIYEAGLTLGNIEKNAEWTRRQAELERQSRIADIASKMNASQNQRPSSLDVGLQVLTALGGLKFKSPTPATTSSTTGLQTVNA